MQNDLEKDPAGLSFQTNAQSGVEKGLSDQHTVGSDQLTQQGTNGLG